MNLDEVLYVFRTDEDKAKLLAMQIANDRGREVLECIFRGRAKSASEIARELSTPLPTAMFHIERFLEIGIIKVVKTRKSKKLREIKYYGPAKRAILIIPSQKEETMSYITNAVKTSLITPLTTALVLGVCAVTGFLVKRATTPLVQPMLAGEGAPVEVAKTAPRYAPRLLEFFTLQNPIILVVLGCVLTLVILGVYSSLKKS